MCSVDHWHQHVGMSGNMHIGLSDINRGQHATQECTPRFPHIYVRSKPDLVELHKLHTGSWVGAFHRSSLAGAFHASLILTFVYRVHQSQGELGLCGWVGVRVPHSRARPACWQRPGGQRALP